METVRYAIFLLCAYVGEHAAKDERIELYGIPEGQNCF